MRSISEKRTRQDLIDPALEKAGWLMRDKSKVGIEIPVDGYDAQPWNGVTDYILLRENGEILAVVEAKKTCVDPRQAEAQLTHYVNEIEKHQSLRPFGFLTNGYEIYFVDVGLSSKRLVSGFFAGMTWKTCCLSSNREYPWQIFKSTPKSLTGLTNTKPSGGLGKPLKQENEKP